MASQFGSGLGVLFLVGGLWSAFIGGGLIAMSGSVTVTELDRSWLGLFYWLFRWPWLTGLLQLGASCVVATTGWGLTHGRAWAATSARGVLWLVVCGECAYLVAFIGFWFGSDAGFDPSAAVGAVGVVVTLLVIAGTIWFLRVARRKLFNN